VRVDLVVGKPVNDLTERVVERGLIVRHGDGESPAGVAGDRGFARGMVIVAVGFSAKCGRTAAASVVGRGVEEVLAAVESAGGLFGGWRHGNPHSPGVLLA